VIDCKFAAYLVLSQIRNNATRLPNKETTPMTTRWLLAIFCCGFLFSPIRLLAQSTPLKDAAGFEQWTADELISRAKTLPIDNDRKQGVTSLAIWGNHRANLERLEGRTYSEIHQTRADLIFVTSGQITLTVGGTIVDPRTSSEGEIRGTSISGGAFKTLSTGDVAHIPANTAHQLDAQGKQATFVVFKVDQP
jgi:hypothetical protein